METMDGMDGRRGRENSLPALLVWPLDLLDHRFDPKRRETGK